MATYKSAKKQLDWAMEVIEDEIAKACKNVEMYERLLDDAETKGDQDDINFWFEAFAPASERLRFLRALYLKITHPEFYDENYK